MKREAEKEYGASVGATLYQLRDARDWSQATLARRARVGIATIARIETQQINPRTGKVDVPKSSTLRKLAMALGDGNAERALEAQRALFAAAGYSAEDMPEDEEPGEEIARLRERVEALERQVSADPRDVEEGIRRLLEAYPPERREAALTLMRKALERYTQDPEIRHS